MNRNSSYLQQLLPFVQVVRCGSFVAAATKMQVTPAAISKSIARLERDLGVRLFNRTTRRLDLSVEGRQFYERISGLLTGVDEAVAVLTNASQEPQGLVRASVTATFGRHCVAPIVGAFLARFPRVELDFSFDEIPPSLVEEGFDVSIQHHRGRETSHVSRPLCDYPIALVASPEYIRRRGSPRRPQDLAAHDCIGIRLPFGRAPWHLTPCSAPGALRQKECFVHHPVGPVTVATQLDVSLIACVSGAGIVPSSVPVILPYLRSGQLKVVLPEYRVRAPQGARTQVFVLFPHRKHMPARVRVLVDFLLEHFRETHYASIDLAQYAP